MRKRQHLPLSAERRVILVFVASALAGIVLVGLALSVSLHRAALAQCRTNLEGRARVLAAQCDSEITGAQRDLEFLSKLPAFQQLSCVDRVDPTLNGVPEDVEVEKRHLLAHLMDKSEQFSVLFILRPNADVYLEQPFTTQLALKKTNLADRLYFQEAVRTKKTAMSDSLLGAGGMLGVAMLVPVLGESGEVTSYLGAFFYLSNLSQLVNKERVKPFDAGYIVDREGLLIAHTDTALLQEGRRERFAEGHPSLSRFLASVDGATAVAKPTVSFDQCTDPADGEPHLSALVRLSSGWSLGLMRSRGAVLAEARPVIWRVTALAGLLLALIGGLGVTVAHGIGRRWDAAERALRASEERFRLASQSISDVIWEWDITTGRLGWFGDVDGLLGYAPGEFPRTIEAWEALIAAEDRDRVIAALEHHCSTGEAYAQEYRVRKKDGRLAYWQDRGVAVRDEQGKAVRMFGAVSDVTERIQAEQALARRVDDLAQFNAAAVGRELRMVELKEEVNELARRLVQPPPYEMESLDATVQTAAPGGTGGRAGDLEPHTTTPGSDA